MSYRKNKIRAILIFRDFDLIKKFYRNYPGCTFYSWLFLSKDFTLYMKLKNILPDKTSFINDGDELQKIAHEYRQQYIDYIGKAGANARNLCWYLTSPSEKNPFVSNVFLYFCYLRLLHNRLDTTTNNLVVICDSYSLIDAIVGSFNRREDISFERYDSKVKRSLSSAGMSLLGPIKKTHFITRFFLRVLIARLYTKKTGHRLDPDNCAPLAIHSWTDARSFANPDSYSDIYFGRLNERIQKTGKDFFYICTVLPTIFFPYAVWKLNNYTEKIFLLEEFLSFGEILSAARLVGKKLPVTLEFSLLASMDISPIITSEILHDRNISTRAEYSLLYYFAAKRLGKNLALLTVVYTFENHIWEKMLCAGFRDVGSHTCLAGYAHSVICPMYLFYSISANEHELVPLPRLILVNGPRAQKVLADSGFSRVKILISGAYRYESSIQKSPRKLGNEPRKTILVVPTAGVDETLELLNKVILAFGHEPNIQVIIKLHPTTPPGCIVSGLPALPGHFQISEKPTDSLLDIADLVLFTESAVSIEALRCHIPVVHIRSDIRIDMNLLEGIFWIKSISNPKEILHYSRKMLQKNDFNASLFDTASRDFFSTVNEDIVWHLVTEPGSERN